MATIERAVRQSVSLSPRIARRVRTLARTSRTSASRVLAELVETGLDARDAQKRRFLDLAEELASTEDRAQQVRIKEELARMTFGD